MHLRNLVTWLPPYLVVVILPANANGLIFLSLRRHSSAQILLGSIESASYSTTPHHLSTHRGFGRVAAFCATTFIYLRIYIREICRNIDYEVLCVL
jgi:hypothetical protein